ncbi:hypothetical protein K438DRAFT_1088006 [Mycena galopus ATCC 62051]|nr:hypothetical protein K438DRAFT_1088006 [Mycena galopus ATCC 62051]
MNSGSPPSATSSTSPASVSVQASTSPTPLSSVGATSSSSNSVSATSISGVSSSSATTGSAPVASASSPSSAPVPSIAPSGSGTAEAGNGSSSSSTNGGSPKTLAIGLTVLAVVFTGCVVTALVVCIRQRRKRKNYGGSSDSSSRPPLSPAGSIMPIMRPPQMRQSDFDIPNPFIDPPSEPPSEISSLDIQFNSSLMQRRMEGRSSPGSPASAAPTIPLPDIPRSGIDGRSNSPATHMHETTFGSHDLPRNLRSLWYKIVAGNAERLEGELCIYFHCSTSFHSHTHL